MSLINKVKQLPNPILVIFILGKLFIGLGLGILLAKFLHGFAVLSILLGIILSIPAAIKIWKK